MKDARLRRKGIAAGSTVGFDLCLRSSHQRNPLFRPEKVGREVSILVEYFGSPATLSGHEALRPTLSGGVLLSVLSLILLQAGNRVKIFFSRRTMYGYIVNFSECGFLSFLDIIQYYRLIMSSCV